MDGGAERRALEKIFAGFQSTVDWPGGYFYKELTEAYPDAVVLLSVRDPQSWAKSAHDTVWSVRHGESLMRLLSSAWGEVDPKWRGFLEMVDGLLWKDKGTLANSHETLEQLAEGMVAQRGGQAHGAGRASAGVGAKGRLEPTV